VFPNHLRLSVAKLPRGSFNRRRRFWSGSRLDDFQSHRAIYVGSGRRPVCSLLACFSKTFPASDGSSTIGFSQAPLAWVNHQRINRARAILETSDLSIEQVADRSGLGSAANLRKHFKRCFGNNAASLPFCFQFNLDSSTFTGIVSQIPKQIRRW